MNDAAQGASVVLGAAGTLYLLKQMGKDIEMEGQHWIMLLVILVAGYGLDTPEAIAQAAGLFDPAKFAGVVFNEHN